MNRRLPRQRQAGFIITIELILIVTILVIGSLAGLVMIRDALVKRMVIKQGNEITVYDANGVALGKAIALDEHQAPIVPYIDRSVPPAVPDPAHRNYRALIGVRDDRFTSREPVYYSGPDCTGTPCIKATSDEVADNTGVSGIPATGAVSYLNALQGGPNYAIGASPDGIKGHLYRSTALACPVAPADIQSRYLSQLVVVGSPCQSRTAGGGTSTGSNTVTTPAFSATATGQTVCDPATDPTGTCLCLIDPAACNCAQAGGESQSNILAANDPAIQAALDSALLTLQLSGNQFAERVTAPIPVGDICCEAGSTLSEADLVDTVSFIALIGALEAQGLPSGQETQILDQIGLTSGQLQCIPDSAPPEESVDWGSLVTLAAEPVPDPGDAQRNALDRFAAPFLVNLPADAVDSWISTPPDGIEGVLR